MSCQLYYQSSRCVNTLNFMSCVCGRCIELSPDRIHGCYLVKLVCDRTLWRDYPRNLGCWQKKPFLPRRSTPQLPSFISFLPRIPFLPPFRSLTHPHHFDGPTRYSPQAPTLQYVVFKAASREDSWWRPPLPPHQKAPYGTQMR